MNTTSHSEFHPINTVYINPPAHSWISQQTINDQWRALNYLSQPDFSKAIDEYRIFKQLMKESSVEVIPFESSRHFGIDSIYCRDASIATDYGMIICNMGKGVRSSEPVLHESMFEERNIPILGKIQAPGTIEGGDVAWVDQKTLAVAHGYRTNQSGFEQLTSILSPFGIQTIQVQLPHYKGPDDVFHLMSVFSPVDKDLAVIYSPLMPVKFRNFLLDLGYAFVEVPDDEFDSLGCNVLALGPRKCMMVSNNPKTRSKLESAGCTVLEYEGKHISLLGGGGPTCLTRPITRIIN